MKHSFVLSALLPLSLASLAAAQPAATGRPVGYPMYPCLSPDGSTVVFSFGGDLWQVASAGGTAQRITSHPSNELRSCFSPDGSVLAFESERDGPANIYMMSVTKDAHGLNFGDVKRVTTNDRAQSLSAFSNDSSRILFHANLEPSIFRGTHLYSVPANGRGPTLRITDAWGSTPIMSGDGTFYLFTRNKFDPTRPAYQGSANSDVFRLDAATGAFSRLTTNDANDADASPLPDGSIAYVSARDGQNNIWRLPKGATTDAQAQQLTSFKPRADETTIEHGIRDFSVAPRGSLATFAVWDTLYTIDLSQPTPQAKPIPVTISGDLSQLDYFRTNLSKQVSEAQLSPDGKTIALVARGEIYVRSTEKDRPTRRVTDSAARERDIAWAPDGSALYFASDESGTFAIYKATVDLAREDIEPKKKSDAKADETKQEEPKASDAKKDDVKKDEAKKDETKSEDGKSEGDKSAAKPDEGKHEKKADKKPDFGKRWADSLTFKTEPVLVSGKNDRSPHPSPDGKWLLFTRTRGDLVIMDLATKSERVILPGWNEPDALWCPDSRHVIYSKEDEYFNADIWVLDTQDEKATPLNITRHPDTDASPRLSADGKVLYFLSDRDASTNGEMSLYAVNLDRKLDGMATYELAEYFKNAAEAAKKRKPLGAEDKVSKKDEAKKDEGKKDETKKEDKADDSKKDEAKKDDAKAADKKPEPMKLDVDDAYRRVRQIVSASSLGNLEITPGGERVFFTASIDGTSALSSVDYKGKDRKSVATGDVGGVTSNFTGEKVTYISGGEASIGKPTGGEAEKMSIDAPVTIEIEQQQKQKFLEAARLLGENFYHPTLKGLDWESLTKRYLSLASKTRTDTEFNAVVNNLFGELDGSHLGIRGGRTNAGEGLPQGYLGVDAVATATGWKITHVIAEGPADRETSKLAVGDTITAVNGQSVIADGAVRADLPALLSGASGRETLLKVTNDKGEERVVLITPTSNGAETLIRYSDEVSRRAAMVEKLSNGKIGYLHIRSMDLPSVHDFERDLYAAAFGKQGLIIDVRDNGGGWTTDILLASLTAPRHAYTVSRGADPATMPRDAYPRDRRLIYAYNRQISVLINQNSYSNAEIFPHSIKTTGRGKLVGIQTFGAVISTGSATLIDGTTVRMPTRGWYLPDGTDMEKHGASPDIRVEMPPEAEVAGTDPQIEAAVKELLERSVREPFWDIKK